MKIVIWIIVIVVVGFIVLAALPVLGMIFGSGGFDP